MSDLAALAMKKSQAKPEEGKSNDSDVAHRQAFEIALRKRVQEIGITEPEYYYIAERSLKQSSLPANWIEASTNDGFIYYFNQSSGESIWTHPKLPQYKEQYERAKLTDAQQRAVREVNASGLPNKAEEMQSETKATELKDSRDHNRSLDSVSSRGRSRRRSPRSITPRSHSRSADSRSYSGSGSISRSRSGSRSRSWSRSRSRSPSDLDGSHSRTADLEESKDSKLSIAGAGISAVSSIQAHARAAEQLEGNQMAWAVKEPDLPPLTARGAPSHALKPSGSEPTPLPALAEKENSVNAAGHNLTLKAVNPDAPPMVGPGHALSHSQPSAPSKERENTEPPMTARGLASDTAPRKPAKAPKPIRDHDAYPLIEGHTPGHTPTESENEKTIVEQSIPMKKTQSHDQGKDLNALLHPTMQTLTVSTISTATAAIVLPVPTKTQDPYDFVSASQDVPTRSLLAAGAGTELEGLPASDYWHQKHEQKSREMLRMSANMAQMEEQLVASVEKESRLLGAQYSEQQQMKHAVHILQKAISKTKTYLLSHSVPLPASDTTNNVTPSDQLANTVTEAAAYIRFISDEHAQSHRDERGYQRSWQGVSIRLTEELQSCFPPTGLTELPSQEKQRLVSDLAMRLEALAGIITTFGEYIPASQRSYLPPLVKHIRQQAPGNTMVPLELLVQSLQEAGITDNSVRFGEGKHPLEAPKGSLEAGVKEKLALVAPSELNALRLQLEGSRQEAINLREKFHAARLTIEEVTAKYVAAEQRLEDSRLREESALNKFSQVAKQLEQVFVRTENIPSKTQQTTAAVNQTIPLSEVSRLIDRLTTMQFEISATERRAVEAERRCELLLTECRSLKDTQIPALKVKNERKKAKIREIAAKMLEIEAISRSYYSELQLSLNANTKYESECSQLRVKLTHLEKEAARHDNKIVADSSQVRGFGTVGRIESNADGPINSSNTFSVATALMRQKMTDTEQALINEQQSLREMKFIFEAEQASSAKLNSINEALRMQNSVKNQEIQTQAEQLRQNATQIRDLQNHVSILQASEKALKALAVGLNDQICQMQGNFRVFGRVRGRAADEEIVPAERLHQLCKFIDNTSLEWDHASYELDRVFTPQATQAQLFEEVLPALRAVLNGTPLTVLCYGQTNAGKSFTLLGPSGDAVDERENRGIVPRSLESLFELAQRDEKESAFAIRMSILEVFNDQVIDLVPRDAPLKPTPESFRRIELDVHGGGGSAGQVVIEGLARWNVASLDEALNLLARGHANRRAACNNSMEHLHHSHLLIRVHVERTALNGQMIHGLLTFVDLAGSERIKTTNISGQRLREVQNINKSLTCLGDVLVKIANGSKGALYQNHKLTHVLQSAIKHDARVYLFVNLAPHPECSTESVCSLNFATKCRRSTSSAVSKEHK